MRIKINENETYEINISEDILSPIEFQSLLFRLNSINKVLGKDILMDSIKKERKPYTITNERKRSEKRPWSKDREFVLDLVKLHYLGVKEDKTKKARELGMEWDDVVKSFHNLMIRHNIKPEEIGIPFFPERRNPYRNIFILRRIINEKGLEYIPKKKEKNENNKYEEGIIHYDINGKYGCNEAVNPNISKLSKDWSKITCDNCKRKFGGNNNGTKTNTKEEEEKTEKTIVN